MHYVAVALVFAVARTLTQTDFRTDFRLLELAGGLEERIRYIISNFNTSNSIDLSIRSCHDCCTDIPVSYVLLHRCYSPEHNILSVCGTLLQCNMCLRIRKVSGPADALTAVVKAEADVAATGKAFCEAKEVQSLGLTKSEADALAAGAKAAGDDAATGKAFREAQEALAGAKAKLTVPTA